MPLFLYSYNQQKIYSKNKKRQYNKKETIYLWYYCPNKEILSLTKLLYQKTSWRMNGVGAFTLGHSL